MGGGRGQVVTLLYWLIVFGLTYATWAAGLAWTEGPDASPRWRDMLALVLLTGYCPTLATVVVT